MLLYHIYYCKIHFEELNFEGLRFSISSKIALINPTKIVLTNPIKEAATTVFTQIGVRMKILLIFILCCRKKYLIVKFCDSAMFFMSTHLRYFLHSRIQHFFVEGRQSPNYIQQNILLDDSVEYFFMSTFTRRLTIIPTK